LTREIGEGIWIGESLVQILKAPNGKLRLGIVAPASVRILRAELLQTPPDAPPDAGDRAA